MNERAGVMLDPWSRAGGSLGRAVGMAEEKTDWSPPEEFDEYRLIRPLGKGSMGQVFLAHDMVLERTVAVKFVAPAAWNPKIRRRFLTEARAAARVQHPNVIAIHRIGEIRRRPYLITEFAEGTSLEKTPRPMPYDELLRVAIGLARGLAAAHRRGVLHRDIKLANAVLGDDGVVKILDFGLAKLEKRNPVLPPEAPAGEEEEAAGAKPLAATLPRDERDIERELEEAETEDDEQPAVSGRWKRIEVDATVKPVVSERGSEDSEDDMLVGTPRYMAPELWRLEPATTRSDVYALGVVLYILCCDRTPFAEESPAALAALVQKQDPTPLREHDPKIDARLADVVERCLRRDPDDRYDSAESLRIALESLLDPAPEVTDEEGNPYCGLLAFDASRRSVFFGRSEEIRGAVERLRTDPFVLVAGDSGVGKSSLCRAGVIPRVSEGALDPALKWICVTMVPGRRPLSTLLTVLTSEIELTGPPPESSLRSDDELLRAFSKSARDPSETTLAGAVRDELDGVLRAVRRRSGPEEGRLLFIDQLEELVTMSDPEEAATTGLLLARIAAGIPRMRLLATVRGDFITRVTQIEGLGAVIGKGLMLLQPLSPEGARAAVVGPAQTRGVRFESDDLVEELVETGAGNSLPLLQFALAELWDVRDQARGVITARSLETIGGVSGALARHAESVLSSLLPEQRLAARKLLLRLVTVDDTRATLSEEELTEGEAPAQAALEALVKGRLVAARDSVEGVVYDITHEALIIRWHTLRFWLDEKREARAVAGRVEVAAREWTRLGRPRDALWGHKQLTEARLLEREDLRKHETEFLEASEALIVRRRRRRRVALTAVPVLLGLFYGVVRLQMQRDLQRRVQAELDDASALIEQARASQKDVLEDTKKAFEIFDAAKIEEGEELWTDVLARRGEIVALRKEAGRALENAVNLDPGNVEVRAALASLLFEQAEFALVRNRPGEAEELVARLELYDDNALIERWSVPSSLSIAVEPAEATVTIARYSRAADGSRPLGEARVVERGELALEPGSYVLVMSAPERAEVRYPVLVERGAQREVSVTLPRAAELPPNYIYIPKGRSLFGFGGDEVLRKAFFTATPMHPVTTEGYLIARYETTFGDWLEFLKATPPEQRAALTPHSEMSGFAKGISLSEREDGSWQFTISYNETTIQAGEGERFAYKGRERPQELDWTRIPVSGISFHHAQKYLDWLDRTGAVPGARFCTEHEWERATRGADDRQYPHGDALRPGDANFDETYRKNLEALGPDEIGSYPRSVSPFGVHDLAGNIFEWVRSSQGGVESVVRGGDFFRDPLTARAINRTSFDPGLQIVAIGLRVCATYTSSE